MGLLYDRSLMSTFGEVLAILENGTGIGKAVVAMTRGIGSGMADGVSRFWVDGRERLVERSKSGCVVIGVELFALG